MRWLFFVSIALDQLLNAVLGGYPDETISVRCWREKRWSRYVIDYTLFCWQWEGSKRHCELCFDYEMQRMDLPEEYR